MLKALRFSYENVTLNVEKRLNPLLLMFSAILFGFATVNYLQGSVTMSISDFTLASSILMMNIALQKKLFPALLVLVIVLLVVILAISSELLLQGSISKFLYYYGVIPFYVYYIVGRHIAAWHTAFILLVVWLLWFLSAADVVALQYSFEELLFFTPLLVFSALCAWMFEVEREENRAESYEKGQQHDSLLQVLDEVYYRVDMQGIIQRIGGGITTFTNFSPEEVINQPITMFYAYPEDREAYVEALTTHGKVRNYPITIKGKAGQLVSISMNATIILDGKGAPQYIEGVFRDVSKETQLKQERKEHIEQLEQLSVIDALLTTPDLAAGIEGVVKQMNLVFDTERSFLAPLDIANQEVVVISDRQYFTVSRVQGDGFDVDDFLQDDEVNFYFSSMLGQEQSLHHIFDDQACFSGQFMCKHGIHSHAMILLRTNMDSYWLLGLHNIEYAPLSAEKQRLLVEISRRIGATLNQLLLQKDLESAVVKAEIASKAKGDFVATISHELRTPLHGVIGLLDLMGQEANAMSDEQQQNLALAQASTQVLRSLIDDVLDLSKIESGSVEMQKQSFYLQQALIDALIPFVMKAREKGIVLHLEMRHVAEVIEGDAQRLRQVLLNLVGNAVKFTFQGYVRIAVRQDDEMLYINIEDSGIGIAKDRQINVFKPFYQVHDAEVLGSNLQEKGTGLGTTIAQHFITMMGGELTLQSEPTVGSTMMIRLPLHQVGQAHVSVDLKMEDLIHTPKIRGAEQHGMSQRRPKSQRWRILLAEDDPVGRHVAEKRLVRAGFSVDVVADGLQAYAKLQEKPFDLLLTDIQMPGLSGLQLTKKIRSDEQKKSLPILLIVGLSAFSLEEVRRDALAAGMNAFISKPVDMTVLMTVLEDSFNSHE
ncbi:MAG: ATP-binding protein [Ghiorsea sp.]|nr:ATP-binding protein [Ghiorsea sp.]